MGLLGEFGIDLSGVTVTREGGTDEIIIADGSTRTVFGNYASFHAGPRQWNEPQRRDVQHSDIVCLDPYFRDQSRLGAEICVELGKPYVTLDCPHDGTIAQHAAAVVISHELRDQTYAGRDCLEVFTEYQEHCEGLVMFTFGSDAVWYGRRGGSRRTYQPYSIDPVDTTGAGDSFRAGIAYGLLQGWKDEQTIEFASAVAACVCLTVPHALGAPGLDGVHQFMERHRQAGPLRG
jgi:sugar/nucleoside kinase (ribokinase family)